MSIRVLGAGLQTTIQDLGRPTHQREGIPASGAMDRAAIRIANLLVGNDEGAAALEATLIGPTLTFDAPTLVAIGGGDLSASVEGISVPAWHPFVVGAGATLRFGHARVGCRAYIAIAGGIAVEPVFDSRSTYLRANFGGFDGRALRASDVLSVGSPSETGRAILASLALSADAPVAIARWSAGATLRPRYGSNPIVHATPGAHLDRLTPESRAQLSDQPFRVSASSDRMGYRLEAATPLTLSSPVELLSEAVTFGTIQLPPGGAPIVLMADRQTTGGYPRIAEVASIDLPLVAQLKPGDQLRFRLISLEEAQRLYLAREAELRQARAAIAWRTSRGRA